jgi:hypothetical protein
MEREAEILAEIKDGRLVCPHCKAHMAAFGEDEDLGEEDGDGFLYYEPVQAQMQSHSNGKILDGKLLVDRSSTDLDAPDGGDYEVADYVTPYVECLGCNEILEIPQGLGIEWYRG